MLHLTGGGSRLCDGLTRRELLRIGGLALGGLTLPGWVAAHAQPPDEVLPEVDDRPVRADGLQHLGASHRRYRRRRILPRRALGISVFISMSDADVALRRHHLAAGSGAGRGP